MFFMSGSAAIGVAGAPVPSAYTFLETFTPVPSAIRGRGGDLDPTVWGVARFTPDGVNAYPAATLNHVQTAAIPATRSTYTGGSPVYPPYDIQVCDSVGAQPIRLMTVARQQFYGECPDMRIRQAFDFASRTGTIGFDVDAVSGGVTETWVNLDITEDPIPAHTFLEATNHETGPIPKNAVLIAFSDNGTAGHVTVGNVNVYASYVMTTLTPTFTLSGASRPTVSAGFPNRTEVRMSTTSLEVWMSDYTPDYVTFPNFQKIYAANLSLGWSRGYVHCKNSNHATEKFSGLTEHVYYWGNIWFDGPAIAVPRAYELPDNTHISTVPPNLPDEPGYDYTQLAWEVSDGVNKAEGFWNGAAHVGPVTVTGSVNLSGATSAHLTLNLFANAVTHTADTSWTLKYRFNGGTWRSYAFSAGDVTAINTAGSAGNLALVIPVLLADLNTGTNTLDCSAANLPMDYPPLVMNCDLEVAA